MYLGDDGEGISITDKLPGSDEKQVLMALSEVEVLLALCDYSDALAFGAEYMEKEGLATSSGLGKGSD